jgi:hypothetical protein
VSRIGKQEYALEEARRGKMKRAAEPVRVIPIKSFHLPSQFNTNQRDLVLAQGVKAWLHIHEAPDGGDNKYTLTFVLKMTKEEQNRRRTAVWSQTPTNTELYLQCTERVASPAKFAPEEVQVYRTREELQVLVRSGNRWYTGSTPYNPNRIFFK